MTRITVDVAEEADPLSLEVEALVADSVAEALAEEAEVVEVPVPDSETTAPSQTNKLLENN